MMNWDFYFITIYYITHLYTPIKNIIDLIHFQNTLKYIIDPSLHL